MGIGTIQLLNGVIKLYIRNREPHEEPQQAGCGLRDGYIAIGVAVRRAMSYTQHLGDALVRPAQRVSRSGPSIAQGPPLPFVRRTVFSSIASVSCSGN